jgi:hypothetical protein
MLGVIGANIDSIQRMTMKWAVEKCRKSRRVRVQCWVRVRGWRRGPMVPGTRVRARARARARARVRAKQNEGNRQNDKNKTNL